MVSWSDTLNHPNAFPVWKVEQELTKQGTSRRKRQPTPLIIIDAFTSATLEVAEVDSDFRGQGSDQLR